MKTFTILFTFFYYFTALAAAPYGIKGQKQAATLYSNVHQFPNNQVTNMGGIDALVETGNSNILSNPSFEHLTANTDWTDNGTATGIATTVAVISGKKALAYLPSAQTFNLIQSSTLYASQFADGVQGLAMVRVKSDIALKVCSIQAGTVSTTNCVTTNTDLKWGLYKVPFILGGTSNGISISTNGTLVTGTVIVDDAFVGAVDLKVDGTSITTQSSSLAVIATLAAGATLTSTPVTTGSGLYSFSSGVYTALDNININLTASMRAGVTQVQSAIVVNGSTIANDFTNIATAWASSSWSGSVLKGQTFSFINSSAVGSSDQQTTQVIATKIIGNQVYTSNNADTNWASCGLTGAAFTGFGSSVPTPSLQCKREGSDLLMKGTFTAGTTPTAVEARLSLPVWNGVQLVSAGSSIIPSLQMAGKGNNNRFSATDFTGITMLIEPSVSYLTFGREASTVAGTDKNTGTAVAATGTLVTLNARIPIEGWNNSNIIVGSFLDLNYVAARGVQSSGQSIANTGFLVTVTYDSSKTYDTHNALNTTTGVFTAPMAGYYKVETSIMFNSAAWALNYAECVLVKNSASYSTMGYIPIMAAGTYFIPVKGADTVYLAKNDTLSLGAAHTRTAGAANLILSGVYNYFSITRVPGQ